MGIQIRQAAPEDADAACRVLCRSITECCVQDHQHKQDTLSAWLGNKTPATVGGWFSTPSNYPLVAERDGALIGVALLTQAGKLALCYVLPEMQGQGVGKALVEGLEAQARVWGISKLKLHSTATASEFFVRRGYLHAGKEKSCFGLECDFLWKKLDEVPVEGGARKRFCNCSGG